MSNPVRMTAHEIAGALDFNEIDAEDKFVDAPSYDALAAELAECRKNNFDAALLILEKRAREAALRSTLALLDVLDYEDASNIAGRARALLPQTETPVSTLCAICDQIKELHPRTHEWTAKETASKPHLESQDDD